MAGGEQQDVNSCCCINIMSGLFHQYLSTEVSVENVCKIVRLVVVLSALSGFQVENVLVKY